MSAQVRASESLAESGVAAAGHWSDVPQIRLTAIWVMLLLSVLSWRSGNYYSGGVDPVVAAKALLSLVSLTLAWITWSATENRTPIGARTVVLVCVYMAAAMVGALASGALFTSGVLTVRISIVLVAVVLVMSSHPIAMVLATLSRSMAGMAMVLAVTGLGSLAATGRLGGGLLPVNPNQIALLVGLPTLLAFWRVVNQAPYRWDLLFVFGYLGLTWLTGSRTGLFALLVAMAVVVLATPRVPAWVHVASTAMVPIAFFLVAGTQVLANFVSRGNDQTVTTLSNRTIAWSAAFNAPTTFWDKWFGGGLAVKTVAVSGQFWDAQVVDSSWVSAFIQAGAVGLVVLAILAVCTLFSALRAASPGRAFWLSLVVYCLVRSFTSSGLVDANSLFLVFLVAAIATEPVWREHARLVLDGPQRRTGPIRSRPRPASSSLRTTGPRR